MITAEFLKKIRTIEIASRKLVRKGMSGQYLSAFRGTGMQFREFRNYVWGDDVRHISWNVSARTTEPVLKLFEEERERTLFLVVDVSSSLRKGPWAARKAERLAELAGVLAFSAADVNDKIGLLLYSDQVESVVLPKKGRSHLLRIIRDILMFEPQGTRTDPNAALRQLDLVLKKHSIVVLLSDMERLPDEKVLRRTSQFHDFLAIFVEEEKEWDLKNFGFLEVESAERARPATLDTSSRGFREYLQAFGVRQRLLVEEHFRQARVDLLSVNTTEDYLPKLEGFFQMRKRHRGR